MRDVLSTPALDGMTFVPGGSFHMGSDRHYPEEGPIRRIAVNSFAIDITPVTNLSFAQFVDATGYITDAEIPPDPAAYPGALPDLLIPGSAVFQKPQQPSSNGWDYVADACWHRPNGKGSSIEGREAHPVVHVTLRDARAYADWAGKSLPTEAEWEYAARGGLDGAEYAWGDELTPHGAYLANFWQGIFPFENEELDGFEGTSPVGSFPPNPYGLFDMIGNVWEWTAERFGSHGAMSGCCGSDDCAVSVTSMPVHILKGGSFLCAPNYCRRYRPAARWPQPVDTSTNHVGFRCVVRDLPNS